MEYYKLTSQDNKTRNETLWGENVTNFVYGTNWLHAYTDKNLSVILNPIHANIQNPKLWIVSGNYQNNVDNINIKFKTLTTEKEIKLPIISLKNKISIGIILCSRIYKENNFTLWGNAWLQGERIEQETLRIRSEAHRDIIDTCLASTTILAAEAAYAAYYIACTAYYEMTNNHLELANHSIAMAIACLVPYIDENMKRVITKFHQ